MWDNPRILNMAAGVLVGVAALAFAVAAAVLLVRSPWFPVTHIDLTHRLQKTTKGEIEAATGGRIGGNFFSVAPAEVRAALEHLPWVRRASVRRVWPDRLEVGLEEHVALARWGDDALINTYGERFYGSTDAPLPQFFGPAGAEHEVAQRYARFSGVLAPLGTQLERVVLTPRYAWQLRLSSGLHIMLGRDADAAEARLRKFVEIYAGTLGRMARKHEYVDLRYPNGFALRMPEPRG
ncbi:MAG TPA: cell division protein FtsQ/DivIB [Burkholderiales bacterium]